MITAKNYAAQAEKLNVKNAIELSKLIHGVIRS